MSESERVELERLKQRHERLEFEISLLRSQLASLETKLNATPAVEPPPAPERKSTTEILQSLQRPTEPLSASPPQPEVPQTETMATESVEIPAPPIIELFVAPVSAQTETAASDLNVENAPSNVSESVSAERPETFVADASAPREVEPPAFLPPLPPRTVAAPEPAGRGSFEMRLGTYWFVRIGVVLVVTALVFLGNLAYQKLGAAGRISLLYAASGLLLGAGAWWQRKAVRESLHNYAQVLFAGGLAAVYFTTYAAHHIPHLRVIQDPLLDGILLSAWAAFIGWIADRKKSELFAFFAVGLAYYSSIITRVGDFTLYSNLVLTLVAVGFLVRNRWAALSSASLFATYGSYVYWRFYNGTKGWHLPTPDESLWFGAAFLMCYWLVFTTAVFFSKHPKLAGANRATFLTLNNGAFFALFLLTMFHVRAGRFWEFALSYGGVLLVLSDLARRFLRNDTPTSNSYLTQGLVLVTIGFVAHPRIAGLDLALILAAESVVLFFLSTLRKNLIIELGSYTSGAMAVAWSLEGIKQFDTRGLWLGCALGAMMLFNAFWSHRQKPATKPNQFRLVPGYFAALALMIWFFTTWQNVSHANIGLALTIEALLLVLSILVLRMPEVAVLGQGYIFLAQLAWAYPTPNGTQQLTALALAAHGYATLFIGWQRNELALKTAAFCVAPLVVIWGVAGLERNDTYGMFTGIALVAAMITKALFVQRQHATTDENPLRAGPTYFSGLAIVLLVATTWFNTTRENCALALVAEGWLLTASVYILRLRSLTLLSQTLVFGGHALWQFNLATIGSPPWWNSLSIIAMTLALGHWWQKQKLVVAQTRAPLVFQFALSLLMVFLICAWAGRECEASTWLTLSCALAVGITVYAAAMRMWMLAICAQIFLLPAGWLFLLQVGQGHGPRFAALAPIAAFGLLSFAAVQWFKAKPDASPQAREPILKFALGYRWLALAMSLWWVLEYIPREQHIWVLTLVGVGIFALAGWWRNREALLFGGMFTITAMAAFGVGSFGPDFVYLPSLLGVFAWLAQQQVARRLPERFAIAEPAHTTVIAVGAVALWIYFTRWVNINATGFFLTASWSALALVLLVCGIGLRERMYRWSGLAILACALGRGVIIDVWKLETIYRILSFAALGFVLLVLGFIYNKYQEKLRQWL